MGAIYIARNDHTKAIDIFSKTGLFADFKIFEALCVWSQCLHYKKYLSKVLFAIIDHNLCSRKNPINLSWAGQAFCI